MLFDTDSSADNNKPEKTYYKDASFVPQSEVTVPLRYNSHDEDEKDEKPTRISAGQIFALCLACLLMGSLGGAFVATRKLAEIDAASRSLEAAILNPAASAPDSSYFLYDDMSGSEIYKMASDQVVSIKTNAPAAPLTGEAPSVPAQGSGFIISSDGYIITNHHLVVSDFGGATKISVYRNTGETYFAEVVGFDEKNDICLIKIEAEGLTPVTIGDSDNISVGDQIYPVGVPFGELPPTITTGIISSTGPKASGGAEGERVFQFDAAVNAGHSGGPVFNTHGEVIGVVAASFIRTGVDGLGFAIPINDAIEIANHIMTGGNRVSKPYLGANLQTVSSTVAQYYSMVLGAYVNNVAAGSCAEISGMKIGDIITEIDGFSIVTRDDVDNVLRSHSVGDTLSIKIWRAGEYLTLTVILDELRYVE